MIWWKMGMFKCAMLSLSSMFIQHSANKYHNLVHSEEAIFHFRRLFPLTFLFQSTFFYFALDEWPTIYFISKIRIGVIIQNTS